MRFRYEIGEKVVYKGHTHPTAGQIRGFTYKIKDYRTHHGIEAYIVHGCDTHVMFAYELESVFKPTKHLKTHKFIKKGNKIRRLI